MPTLNRWGLLALASIAQVSASASQIGVGFLLPYVKGDLELSTAQVSLLPAAMAAGLTLAAFPSGTATDRLGERVVLAGGLLLAGVSATLAAVQSDFVFTALLIAVAGLGIAPSHPAGSRLVLRLFRARERGFAIGVRQTSVPVGGLLVAAAVAPIASAFGWRSGLRQRQPTSRLARGLPRAGLGDRGHRPGPRAVANAWRCSANRWTSFRTILGAFSAEPGAELAGRMSAMIRLVG